MVEGGLKFYYKKEWSSFVLYYSHHIQHPIYIYTQTRLFVIVAHGATMDHTNFNKILWSEQILFTKINANSHFSNSPLPQR
jgi:hypothetical protein